MKTSNLIGLALNYAVSVAEARREELPDDFWLSAVKAGNYAPSTNWSDGGIIIEREGIELLCNLTTAEASKFKNAHADWQAFYRQRRATHERSFGTTPLVAAMRCYVESKFGEVAVPDELCNGPA